jgi:hypothetical protein
LHGEIRFKPDALKELAYENALTYLLNLRDVLRKPPEFLLRFVEFNRLLFDLLPFVVQLVLLLLKFLGAHLKVLFLDACPLNLVLSIVGLYLLEHLLNTLNFVSESGILINQLLLELCHLFDG